MDKRITLFSASYVEDALGNQHEELTAKNIWANVYSVSRNEFFAAGTNGFKPECAAEIWTHEYGGERLAEIDGKRLHVYRSFNRTDGRTELYLSDRVVDNENQ